MTQRGLREATTGDHQAGVETDLAAEVMRLLAGGRREEAAERFGAIIDRQQRRAARIAYHYLRDPAEVDEVVQDAFLKAFLHLPSFREDLFFKLWFTRILVNSCLDRLKAKARRTRWLVPSDARDTLAADGPPSNDPSPEATLLAKERRTHLMAAIDRLTGSLRVDTGRIRDELNWAPPLGMKEGLEETAAWYKNRDNA